MYVIQAFNAPHGSPECTTSLPLIPSLVPETSGDTGTVWSFAQRNTLSGGSQNRAKKTRDSGAADLKSKKGPYQVLGTT